MLGTLNRLLNQDVLKKHGPITMTTSIIDGSGMVVGIVRLVMNDEDFDFEEPVDEASLNELLNGITYVNEHGSISVWLNPKFAKKVLTGD